MKRFLTIAFSFLMFFGFASFISVDTYAAGWTHNGIIVDKSSPQPANTSIKLTANVSGDTSGLQYRFVCTGVTESTGNYYALLQGYSQTNSIIWTPTTPGIYAIHLDVRDAMGRIERKTINYRIDYPDQINDQGIAVRKASPESVFTRREIKASVPRMSDLQYKFVWGMKDNWKS